jgi:hypothetical protein
MGYLQEQMKWPDLNHRNFFEHQLNEVLISKENIMPHEDSG